MSPFLKKYNILSKNRRIMTFCAFIFSIIFFSSCSKSPEKNCLPSEIEITGFLSEKAVNLEKRKVLSEDSGAKLLTGKGVFIDDYTILTVSHVFPPGTKFSGYTLDRRNTKNDLLLLNSKECGNPLLVSDQEKNEIYECTTQEFLGESEVRDNISAKSPFGEETIQHIDIPFIKGEYSLGDSGKPLCSKEGEVVGILMATSNEGAFYQPVSKIHTFLENK